MTDAERLQEAAQAVIRDLVDQRDKALAEVDRLRAENEALRQWEAWGREAGPVLRALAEDPTTRAALEALPASALHARLEADR